MLRPSQRSRLKFESLEVRQMLAGNVTAAVVDGDLIITGDSNDNRIEITEVSHKNQTSFEISGLDTKINGKSKDFVAKKVAGEISIDLQAGDDRLEITDADTIVGLTIRADGGEDRVRLAGFDVDGDLVIRTGGDDDLVPVRNVEVDGDVTVATGEGEVDVLIRRLLADVLSVDTGGGIDTLQITRSTVAS